ncbi:MAG: SPOR domain-containing protein [Dongiaceae bacterium]
MVAAPVPTAQQRTAPPPQQQQPETSPPFGDEDVLDSDPLPAGLAERLAPEPPAPMLPPSGVGRFQEPGPVDELDAPLGVVPTALWDDQPAPPQPPPSRAPGDVAGFPGFQHRSPESRVSDGNPPAAANPPRSRWEPEPVKPASATVSRFAPPPAAPPPRSPAYRDDDPFADLTGADDDETPDEFPLDGFGELQPDDEDDALDPAYAGGDLASMIEPRRSRTPVLIAGVIGLVLVGGIAVAMFRPVGGDAETPPLIVADGEPTRITPSETMLAEADAQNKLIYDRVNAGEENAETTLLTPADEPLAAVPADDSANNAISRVIIPGGPGFDDPAADEGLSLDGQPSAMPADGETQVAASDDPIEAIGPRRVRTVIVKPDGTIVESGASDVGTAAAPGGGAAAVEPADAEPDPPPVVEAPPPAPVTDDTAAIAGTGGGELAITPVPDIGGNAAAEAPPELPAPNPPPAAAAEPPPPAAVAAVDNNAPIDLGQSAAPPSGGMLVQVSSQRSEDAARATFRDLQARYPSILGPYEVNIQRAEIPDRGTFYRVRVGPFSASDAQRLCNDLKTAGGDCIIAQR